MRWSMLSGFAALVLALPLVADDTKKEPEKTEAKKDRKAQFGELKEEYRKQMSEFQSGLKEIKTQKEYLEYVKEKAPKSKDTLVKILSLVEENPKDELSLEMLTAGLNMYLSEPRTTAPAGMSVEAKKILKTLTDAHAASPKVATLVKSLSQRASPDVKPLLEKVFATNTDKEAKAFAAFALGNMAFEQLDSPRISDADRKTVSKEAEKYFDLLATEFGDVTLGKRTFAQVAKGTLFDLRNLQVGMKAPEAVCENLDGKKEKLSDYLGKVVVVDIWATWCPPCRAMIPHEREMVEHLKDKPFALISVSADAKKETLEDFLKNEKMPWNHWWAGNGEGMIRDWNVRYYPTIYVIDAKGIIRHKGLRDKQLEEAVEALLKEVGGNK